MIVDCHVHILNAGEPHLGALLRAADRAGIERLCISSLSREWVPYPTEAALEEAAADVEAACARHPERFTGFVYVSADHVAKSLELMERGLVNGPCRFVKVWISQFAGDSRMKPLYARAQELNAAVMLHTWTKATGNLAHETTFAQAAEVSRRHPQLRLWAAHYGGRWEEAGRIAAAAPGLHLDLSGGEPEDGIVDTLLRHIPAERIFFGSDAPGRSFAVQMAKVHSASASPEEKEKMLGGNILRWIGA